MRDTNLFALALRLMGGPLADAFRGPSWQAWRVVLTAAAGLPCPGEEALELFRQCTGRTTWPMSIAQRLTLVVGRRGGKDRIVALLAVASAAFVKYALSPGERGVVMVLAVDRAQARVTLRYIRALFTETPMLKVLIESETKESISLTSGIDIEVHTSDFRRVRGRTVVLAILNEVAFWDTSEESASPDVEVVNAIEPAMATVPNSLLVMISSPHARRGVLWTDYSEHFGQDHPEALVWQAATRVMNPLVPQVLIDRAYADDDAVADAEYGAQFRKDLEDFVRKEVIAAVTVPDRSELPPRPGVRYVAFVDPSGGSSDSFTLAIAHMERSRAVLDTIRETRAPFDPDVVTEEYAAIVRRFGLREVTGDAYAGEWPRSRFAAFGVTYRVSEQHKSDLYRALLPLLNATSVELLEVPVLRKQLLALERRTSRTGREQIDHPPRQRDDVANAAAGALVLAHQQATRGGQIATLRVVQGRAVWTGDGREERSDAMKALMAAKSAQLAKELQEAAHHRDAAKREGRLGQWWPSL